MTTSVAPRQQSRGQQKPPQKRQIAWKLIGQIVACQIAAILLVEGFFFLNGIGEEEIFQFDRHIGFKHMTNKRITWRTEGFAQSYLNEDGMREKNLTIQKPANTFRVAVLGDSMTEGLQVPIEQSFGQIIEKRLNEQRAQDGQPRQVQILNFATSGYSTVQELLQLKDKVFKYKPDLVLVCYTNRDLFENWASDSKVVTNIRPSAVHLPGGYLFFDTSHVAKWFKSPRGKFLTSIDWIRHESRIWGLWSALELDMSMHNPVYKFLIACATKPKHAVREFNTLVETMKASWSSQPAFQIKFFEGQNPAEAVKPAKKEPATQLASTPAVKQEPKLDTLISAAQNSALESNPVLQKDNPKTQTVYQKIVVQTMASLLQEMKKQCSENGAKLAVVTLPSRAVLAPAFGMEDSFGGIDYPQEIAIVKDITGKLQVPMLDCESKAEELPQNKRLELFYTVHLTPAGQQFLADNIQPFLAEQVK
jgi:hypothetical protein